VNTARTISSPWCSIELKMRKPVSDELRDSRITSTRGSPGRSSRFRASSLRTSGNAIPGRRISFSFARW
jgi:hypothetical protein